MRKMANLARSRGEISGKQKSMRLWGNTCFFVSVITRADNHSEKSRLKGNFFAI